MEFLAFLGTFGLQVSSFTRSTVATYHCLHKIFLSDFLKRLLSKLMLLIVLGMSYHQF